MLIQLRRKPVKVVYIKLHMAAGRNEQTSAETTLLVVHAHPVQMREMGAGRVF